MSVNIVTLVEKRYRAQAQPAGMVAALLKSGASVAVFDETQLDSSQWQDAMRFANVVVARGRHCSILSALDEARSLGVPVVDSAGAIEGVRDKRLMTRTLIANDLPTPPTITAHPSKVVGSHLRYPLIVKPIFGDNSAGLVTVERESDLIGLAWPDPEAIIQEYHPSVGTDLKLYIIDGTVTAVRRPSPITPHRSAELGLAEVTPELRDLAFRCGEAFGLSFFGVDCLELPGRGVQIIEVNDFPNYTSVPYASELLALQVLRRAAMIRPPVLGAR